VVMFALRLDSVEPFSGLSRNGEIREKRCGWFFADTGDSDRHGAANVTM
jgi:hypothetical protein